MTKMVRCVVLGRKVMCFKEHTAVTLEALLPQNNYYRHLEAKLDLSFVRELVKECYATTMGPPFLEIQKLPLLVTSNS